MLRKFIAFVILFTAVFSVTVIAADDMNEIIDNELEKVNAGDFDLVEFKNSFINEGKLPGIKDILGTIINLVFKEASVSIKTLSFLVIPLLLMGILSNLSLTSEGTVKMAEAVCALSLTAVIINVFISALTLCETAISEVNIMSLCMLPVMYSLLLSMGKISTYTVMHPTVIFLIHFIMNVINKLLIPAVLSGFILSLTDSIGGKGRFKRITGLLIKTTKWVLIFLISIFTAILSAQNILTHSFDTVALKGSKFVVANFIPVIGGAIADGTEAVGSSLILIKNATGVAGLIGVMFIIFIPVIRIFLIGLSFYILSAVSQLFSMDKIAEVLDTSGSTVNMLGAIVISTAFLFVISIAVMLGG